MEEYHNKEPLKDLPQHRENVIEQNTESKEDKEDKNSCY